MSKRDELEETINEMSELVRLQSIQMVDAVHRRTAHLTAEERSQALDLVGSRLASAFADVEILARGVRDEVESGAEPQLVG